MGRTGQAQSVRIHNLRAVGGTRSGDPSAADPCPLCDGTGSISGTVAAVDDSQPIEVLTVDRVLAALPQMSPAERQRLYEALHALYDCRIYRR
jgi:hypothetical protein